MIKRLFDLIGASLLLVLFSPAFIFISVVVLLRMGRPIFFKQMRAGRHGRPFLLSKFRTMKTPESLERDDDQSDGARITPLGGKLRGWSLDELPQLWNVLKGNMSLVGPRPLYLHYLPLYSAEQARRHEVKPGITGWAQVNGRNATTWQERLGLDVWYVDNRNFWLDLKIMAKTVMVVLRGEGISQEGRATMEEFRGDN
jgi:sugar transferase EpsL